jgi:hypothetical protein
MKTDELKDKVAALLREENQRPLTAAEIASALQLRGNTKKRLQKEINACRRS